MSWLRSAVNRAVEKNNLTRTVRNYADSVVLQAGNAVFEGAKLIQDRIGARSMKSFESTVKSLEEVSVSCRGIERVQLLRRWLVALKEIERQAETSHDHQLSSDEPKDSPRNPVIVYYMDPGMEGEPMSFRDVFLHSQALEGIILSMIVEEPNEEEVGLLLELFGLCLTGGKEAHETVISYIQELAMVFPKYQDEVLAKREELLQYAQAAIAGLKINADLARIDTEAHSLIGKLDKMKALEQPSSEDSVKSSEITVAASTEAFQEDLEQIWTFSKLEALLLKKKFLSNGDSPEIHNEKVDKLKVLSESLVNSTLKAEKRILEHRFQKEEALNYRVAKTNEVNLLEKDLAEKIRTLELQKDELEAELEKVNSSLVSAKARIRNAREEREKFDESSNQILMHLKSKEVELSRSISSCRLEADVVNRWIKFLEDTWTLQAACTDQKEKQVNGELERCEDHFVNLVFHLLSAYKDQLEPYIPNIRNVVKNLESNESVETATIPDNGNKEPENPRKQLEKEYLDLEAKFVTTLSVADAIKNQFYSQIEGISRKDDQNVKQLFDALDKTKEEFESIQRPCLEIESPTRGSMKSLHRALSLVTAQTIESPQHKEREKIRAFSFKDKKSLAAEAEIRKMESELDDCEDYLAEEIDDWEFDAAEKDLDSNG